MSLAIGTRLGPYEILSPLGAGGMGEVYKAKDTRLDRTVAVKVLKLDVSSTPEAHQRFDREAKTISQLSHPHICALYDVGRVGETEYLVMELLEGETLAARLTGGALPLDQTLRYGVEIAGALDHAHRHGIVHRDLKPGNVMLTKSGIKLLDFGLAKLQALSGPVDSSGSQLATAGAPLTTEGTLVGTLQYMAPEQLEGEEADARSDVFAFGAVLYEMATGRRAFSAASRASLITAIMSSDPAPISTIRPMTPPALDRAVKKCLARDRDDRWQSAADLESELKWIGESTVPNVAPAALGRRGMRNRLSWATAGFFFFSTLALTVAIASRGRSSPEAGAIRFSILPPTKLTPDLMSWDPACLALSPDGRSVVFCAATPDGKHLLWVRSLDSLTPRALSGTDGATCPFWSPDNRSVGFFADGNLKRIEVGGGPALTVCAAPDGRGGAWSPAGSILFAPSFQGPLLQVPVSGGAASPVTAIDPARHETTHRWPQFLPDGKHFLYLAASREASGESEQDSVYLGSLDSRKSRILLHARSNASYAAGYLLFVREQTLMAQRFALDRLELTGEAFPIVKKVQYQAGYFRGVFSASENGVLAYQEGGSYARSRLLWFDRKGKQVGSVGEPGGYFNAALSPDERKMATDLFDPEAGTGDLWIYELANGVKNRFTFGAGENFLPIWSPNGSHIVFASNRKGHTDLYQKTAASGGSEEELLVSNTDKEPTDWSPDGRFIAFNELDSKGKTKEDLRILPLFGDRKPFAFLESPANEVNARFSPDGRWVAYVSDESGRNEVYAAPFPGANAKWQISAAGGDEPRWRHDGRELFYMSADGKMMAAEMKTSGSALEVGAVLPLFATQSKSVGSLYDVSADGQRFLINSVEEKESSPITLVVNWTAQLKK